MRRYPSIPSPRPALPGSRDKCERIGPGPQECGRGPRRRGASQAPSVATSATPSRRQVSLPSPRHTDPGKMSGGAQLLWSWRATDCRARSSTSRTALASTRTVPLPLEASAPRPPRPSRPARTVPAGAPACSRPARLIPTRDLRASTLHRARQGDDCQSPPQPTHIIMRGEAPMARPR